MKIEKDTIVIIVLLSVLIGIAILGAVLFGLDHDGSLEIDDDYYIEYIDPDTGVHYLIIAEPYRTAISVRYNSDGTIMTDLNK